MKIRTEPDNTGFAPPDSRWSAIDSDTYDGAEDSHCPIGWGATEAEAIADLMEQIDERVTMAEQEDRPNTGRDTQLPNDGRDDFPRFQWTCDTCLDEGWIDQRAECPDCGNPHKGTPP